jgi:nitrobenzene nitroreductase
VIAHSKLADRVWLSVPIVDEVIRARRAVRRYLPRPVPAAMVRDVLEVARHAPSGSNIQPWKCYVVTGGARDQLVADALAAFRTEFQAHGPEYDFYPAELPQPFLGRRGAFGMKLGRALDIDQADMAARMAFMARNFMFFDAPVGLIFTIDRGLERASFIDYGAFLQNVMLAARARGLDTCAQQTWAMLHKVLRARLPIGEGEMVVCGMAMGWADPDGPENRLGLDKESVDSFATFLDEPVEEEFLLAEAA